MHITASAVSLDVADVEASSQFLRRHFGWAEIMSADGFASLTRADAGLNVIFLRTGLGALRPVSHAGPVGQGLLLVFVVDDVDREWARLQAEGVPVATPLETEPWGERCLQVLDPNGIVVRLVQWAEPVGSA